jgi:LysR family glycine cleavage system transcriptional activator
MALGLPPFSCLRLFETAARFGSFKRAAQELNLTPGALSHGIDTLEQWLDVDLFERKARGVILTPAGRQYLPYVSEALSLIATGTRRLPSRRFENRVSISSTDLFAYELVLPRLHKFRQMYPDTVVTVDASRRIAELPAEQFDLAIRNSREPWPKLSCDLIGPIRFVPVGAPQCIDELSHGGALDWSRATLIHTAAASEDWETWCSHSRTNVSSARKLVVGSTQLALEAAAAGLGLAIGYLPIIDPAIAAGRVAIAVDHIVPAMSSCWLVTPSGAETRREIVAFRNWLLKEMSQLAWNGPGEARTASQY